jgi:hypothetical protein
MKDTDAAASKAAALEQALLLRLIVLPRKPRAVFRIVVFVDFQLGDRIRLR